MMHGTMSLKYDNELFVPQYLADSFSRRATIGLVIFNKTPSLHTIGYILY